MHERGECKREVIPEHVMLARIAQSEQMREFFIQMWMQNPGLAKQGGARVQSLLTPLDRVEPEAKATASSGAAKQRGISLIELIMFIVIVSAALAGVLRVMNQITGRSADPLLRKQALAVAESMLEEVQLQDLNPAACTGALAANAARSGVGCVADYNGYSTTAGILDFSTNAAVAGLGNYNIMGVAVAPIAALGGTAIMAGSGVMISVTVADPTGAATEATGYRVGN